MSESFGEHVPQQETQEAVLEKKLEIIRDMKCGLDPRIGMSLIVLGLKPATTLDLFTWNESLDSIRKKIGESGLFVDDIRKPPFANPERTAMLAVANSQELATMVAEGFRNPAKNHEELGRYMGYPETAIEAFVGKRELYETEEDEFEKRGLPSGYIGYALSKDNYEQELDVARKWWGAIRQYAPELYAESLGKDARKDD